MKTPYDLEDRIAPRLENVDFLPPLLARISLGVAFLVSARKKFVDREGTVEYFRQLGIPLPGVTAPLAAGTEAVCGSLLGAGLLTRVAAVPLIPVMVVAILTARRKDFHSFSDLTGVYEYTYILLLSYLIVYGGGKASVDHLIRLFLRRELTEQEIETLEREFLEVA